MSRADPARLGHPVQSFGRELADRLQQRVTRRTGATQLAHQALVEQLGQAIEHRQADVRHGVADRLDRLQAGASGEHRARGEEPPGPLGEQVMAPGDRRPQGLLPVRQVAAATSEQAQRVFQPGQDRLRRQQLDPRRGQLDGQRQAVQPAGDLRDGRRVPLVDREVRRHRGGPLGEQAHRLAGGQPFGRGPGARIRDRERRDRAFLLAGDPQRRAAADQDAQRTGLPQQPGHGRGAGQQVLEVVQDEQDLPVVQLADQVIHQRPVPGVLQPEALGDRRRHQPRIPDGRQRHEVDAVRVVTRHLGGQRDAQPGLAAAARPGQRDQIAACEQPSGQRQLAFPADEAGQRPGQATARDVRHSRPPSAALRQRLARGGPRRDLAQGLAPMRSIRTDVVTPCAAQNWFAVLASTGSGRVASA